MKECISLYSEYKSLAPMYTFEFWLETLSKSLIKKSTNQNENNNQNINENRSWMNENCSSKEVSFKKNYL